MSQVVSLQPGVRASTLPQPPIHRLHSNWASPLPLRWFYRGKFRRPTARFDVNFQKHWSSLRGWAIAANSTFRCCSIVTSSDMSSEKCEPSIVTHDCEPVWGTAIGLVANAFISSDRVTAHDYSEDSNRVAERTRVFNSKLIPWSSRWALKKFDGIQSLGFFETRSRARRLFNIAQRFPTSTLG